MAAVLPAFILATLLLAMLPGPATALLIREAVTGDRRRVVGVLAGIEVGIFAWAVFSGLGVAALVAASTLAYAVLKAVGATVLVVLGIQTLWNARKGAPAAKARKVPGLRGFRGGVLTNLANPKAAVFAFSFYPQFIPHGMNVLAVSVLLGLVHVVVDIAWYTTLASVVRTARRFFDRSGVKRWLERVVGAVLIALGLRLAVD
jgi:threonine/homoserine/homoserine lactone efflux protein